MTNEEVLVLSKNYTANAVKNVRKEIFVVLADDEELPETGTSGNIYLKKSSTTTEYNYYDEYVYANNKWELIGNTAVSFEMDDTPTENSDKAVKSGGVYSAIKPLNEAKHTHGNKDLLDKFGTITDEDYKDYCVKYGEQIIPTIDNTDHETDYLTWSAKKLDDMFGGVEDKISPLETAKHTHSTTSKSVIDKFSYDSDSRFKYGNYYVGVINTDNPNSVYGTWNGSKINAELNKKQDKLSNATVLGKLSDDNSNLYYNGNMIASIDDTMYIEDRTWSSLKVATTYGVPETLYDKEEMIEIPQGNTIYTFYPEIKQGTVLGDYFKFEITFVTDTDSLMPTATIDATGKIGWLYNTGCKIYENENYYIQAVINGENFEFIIVSRKNEDLSKYSYQIGIMKIVGIF